MAHLLDSKFKVRPGFSMDLPGSIAQPPELLKRGRGRPRKFPTPPLGVVFPKRARGRPRVSFPPAQQPEKALSETDLGQQPPVEMFAKRGPGRPPKGPAGLLPDGTFEPRPRGRPPKATFAQPLQAFPKRVWGQSRGRGRGRGRPPKTSVELGGETLKELSRIRDEIREVRDTIINRLTRLEEGVQMVRYDMQRFSQTATTATATATTNGRPDTLTPHVPEVFLSNSC